VMATLFVRKLLLWPRFHATVGRCLSLSQPEVEELSVPMSDRAAAMQQALIQALEVR
jgi:DNA excision repair protein ERCC-4